MPKQATPQWTSERVGWQKQLIQSRCQPLELCPDFPIIAERWEAWWRRQSIGRPLIVAKCNRQPDRPILRHTDLLDQPERWLQEKLRDVEALELIGEALPTVRVDFGPAMLGGLVGGRMEFHPDTSWTHPYIEDDWSNAPGGTISPENPIWIQLCKLTEMVASQARGRFVTVTPDLGGSADVLLNLRGSEAICIDVLEQPEWVRQTIDSLYPAWQQAFTMLYRTIVARHAAPLVHWLEIWSDQPYVIPACDLNFLIGPHAFREVCLPDIVRLTRTVDRAVFHLDGPGAAKHIDDLLNVESISAIQFTPGEGTPSVRPWLDMFRKIQAADRSLWVVTPFHEVDLLTTELDPAGLALCIGTVTSKQAIQLRQQFAHAIIA